MAVTWKKLAYEVDVIKLSVMTEIGDIIYCSALGPPVVASPLADTAAGSPCPATFIDTSTLDF